MKSVRGRPRRQESLHKIYVSESTFQQWNDRKAELGMEKERNNSFALFLLNLLMDLSAGADVDVDRPKSETYQKSTDGMLMGETVPFENLMHFSTPVAKRRKALKRPTAESVSSIENSFVDVTGNSSDISAVVLNPISSTAPEDQDTSFAARLHSASHEFGMLPGIPFEKPSIESYSDCTSDSASDTDSPSDSSCDNVSTYSSSYGSDSVSEDDSEYGSSEYSECSLLLDELSDTELNSVINTLDQISLNNETTLQGNTLCDAIDVSSFIVTEDKVDVNEVMNATFLKSNAHIQCEQSQELSQYTVESMLLGNDESQLQSNPVVNLERDIETFKANLQKRFRTLSSDFEGLEREFEMCQHPKIVVSVEKLKDLKGRNCEVLINGKVCGLQREFTVSGKGSVKHLSWKCNNSHLGTWCSSEVLARKHYSDVYVNDVLIPSCILLSGNNYTKFKLFCKFLNLASPEMLSFSRNQNFFCFPEIIEFWECMKKETVDTMKPYSDICICGDGRNDSPGHSARYGVYVAMEHFTKIVLDLEVMDAREVGGVSTNMEREGMTRIVKRLCNQIMIGEIITDASSSVTKRIRELKESCPSLINTFHAYDTWHKAKCLSKALHKKAKEKGNGELVPWIEPIINHFWYACEQCKQDVSKLKAMLVGIVHHVCGEHEWGLSQCLHGPLSDQEPKTYLTKNSKPVEALREIIFDKKLLSSLHFYTHFRHTSDLESFNSMMTKYVPKRIAFEYMSFICRTALAGIDHNMHAFREVATTKDGRKCYKRRYSKRSKRYHAEPLKVGKEYSHIPLLLARILRRRALHMQSVSDRFLKSDTDPKQISPTIAMKGEPPATDALVEEGLARKKNK